MGKLNIFKIELAQPRGVYYGGQWLQGYVCVELNEPMKMRGIRLAFHGGGKVSFVETKSQSSGAGHHGARERQTRTQYRSLEDYFNHTMYIFGAPDPSFLASNSPTLAAGRYHYPFQFLLPAWLPSSFEGDHGHVRYSLRAVIDKPWKFDHETRKLFTVVGVMDLNKVEDAPSPGELSGDKTICCLCCASGPVGANMKIERRGYVPGENIFISGEITNNSSRRMKSVKIVIAQKVGFHALECSRLESNPVHSRSRSHGRRKHRVWSKCSFTRWVESDVLSLDKGELPAGETLTIAQEAIKVPPVPPSCLSGCGVIDIQYFLKVVMNPAGPSRKLHVPCQISIGTIPLRTLFNEYNEAARRAGHTTHPGIPAMPAAPPGAPPGAAYPPPGAPPPYFAESHEGRKHVHEEGQSEYMHGDTEWAPVYPYYDFHNMPQGHPQGAAGGGAPSIPPQSLPQATMQVPTIGFQPPTPEAESVSAGAPSS